MITEEDLHILNNLILDNELNEKEMILLDKLYNLIKTHYVKDYYNAQR